MKNVVEHQQSCSSSEFSRPQRAAVTRASRPCWSRYKSQNSGFANCSNATTTTHGRDGRVTFSSPKLLAALFTLFLLTAPAFGEHFSYDLTIDNGREKAHGVSDDDPPPMGRKPREVIHVKKGEPLVFQFIMNSNFPHDAIKKVGVLYYIAPADEVGQKTLPEHLDQAVLRGHFTMDFKPETGRVGVRQQFHIDKPGVYLARVESENSASDHEHFAAIDIVVE